MSQLDFELSPSSPSPEGQATLTQNKLESIKRFCAEGYSHYDKTDYKAALRLFYQAWLLLPKPQSEFDAAGWVLTAIGDTYFKLGQYAQAIEALSSAIHCQGIEENPFVYLRLGQSYLDTQQLGPARRELYKAWIKGGNTLFESEPDKYFHAIKDLAKED